MSLVGNLADLGLGDIFQIVSLSRRSGTLELRSNDSLGEIIFSGGKVVAAKQNNPAQMFGENLLHAGVVSPVKYQEMLVAESEGFVGPDLFEKFGLDSDAVENASEAYLQLLVYDMFTWEEGSFSFVLDDQPDPWGTFSLAGGHAVVRNGLNPQFLAIEGSRLRDEASREDTLQAFLNRGAPNNGAPQSDPELSASFSADLKPTEDIAQAEQSIKPTAPLGLATAPASQGGDPATAQVQPTPAPEAAAPLASPTPASAPSETGTLSEEEAAQVQLRNGEESGAPKTSAPLGQAPLGGPPTSAEPVLGSEPAEGTAEQASGSDHVAADVNGGRKLLVVDDDDQVVEELRRVYAHRFSEVMVAQRIADALHILEEQQGPWFVMSDLIIARSDGRGILGGIELLEHFRSFDPDGPFLLFSDYQNDDARSKAEELGVVGFVLKPRRAQIQAHGDPSAADSPMKAFVDETLSVSEAHLPERSVAVPQEPAAPEPPAPEPPAPEPHAPPAPVEPSVPAPEAPPPTEEISAHDAATAASFGFLPEAPQAPLAPLPSVQARAPMEPSEANMPTEEQPQLLDLGAELGDALADALPEADMEGFVQAAESGELSTLRSMLAELVDPTNRDTVSLLVLRYASHVVERGGLFLATRRVYVGLGGFSNDEDSEDFVRRVRRTQIPVAADSVFAQVSRYRSMFFGELTKTDGNTMLVNELGSVWPSASVIAAPLISRDKVAAILFGENPSGAPIAGSQGLEIFLQQAGLAMDRALLERQLEESRRATKEGEVG